MEKLQLRLTADEAERMASAIDSADLDAMAEAEARMLTVTAARLRHLAAKARARDAAHGGT